MSETTKNYYLNDEQANTLSFKIIDLLKGIPISQAQDILENTLILLKDSHLVDIENPQYKIKAADFGISESVSG